MLYGATNSPLRPLLGEVRALARMGFDYLELCLDPPEADPARILAQKADLAAILDGEGLKILVGHLPTFVWTADIYQSIREASLAEIQKALDACVELGVTKAVLHPGYVTGLLNVVPRVGSDLARQSLERLLATAGRLGVTLCFENMFPRAGHMYRPEEFSDILAAYPDLMMTLDLAHASIQAPGDRLRKMIAAGGRRIRHIHVSDTSGKDDEHLPPGVGRVDLAGGLAALKKLGYDETMTLEVFSPDTDYLKIGLDKARAMWDRS